jgi:predicted XRE-type DNA-binding protein
MTNENDDFEIIRGSGNIYADLGLPDAEMRQLRALLAAEVIKTVDAEGLSTRAAHKLTGIAAADFSRIRQVKLDGFTADRLMTILYRLNRDVQVSVMPRVAGGQGALHLHHT